MKLPECAATLLDFWFGPPGDAERDRFRQIWFRATPEFDAALRRTFLADYEAAAEGDLAAWEGAPKPALALVLLLDQVPRNIFRGTARAYVTDAQARAVPTGRSAAASTGRSRRPGACFSTCRFTTARILPTSAVRWR